MNKLDSNWFFNGNLDEEYKQYVLLAYLQYVDKHFKETRLYPHLGELVAHYRNLNQFVDSKQQLKNAFPKELKGIDMIKLRLAYRQILKDDDLFETIDRLVAFALPKIKDYLNNGKEIFDFIEDHLHLYEVGVHALRQTEGYLIVVNPSEDYWVYSFELSIIKDLEESFKSLRTQLIRKYKKSISNTLISIKQDLIRSFTHLPHPATYAIESSIKIPVEDTLLPISKRLLLRRLERF